VKEGVVEGVWEADGDGKGKGANEEDEKIH